MHEERITLTANDPQRTLALTPMLAGAWSHTEAAVRLGLG